MIPGNSHEECWVENRVTETWGPDSFIDWLFATDHPLLRVMDPIGCHDDRKVTIDDLNALLREAQDLDVPYTDWLYSQAQAEYWDGER